MIRIPGRIPIAIHPSFWIFAALIGFLYAEGNFPMMFVWVGIIFVSVLFHEFGHALMSLIFGRNPRIELVAMGGLTFHDGEKLPFWKQFLITLNGPLFGFILGMGAYLVSISLEASQAGFLGYVLGLIFWINMIWTVLNLIPVLPLDGGQLLRIVCEGAFGVKGVKYSLMISMAVAGLISMLAFLMQQFLLGAFFFLFGFQAYDSYRKSRLMTSDDQKQSLKESFDRAEEALEKGQKEEADRLFAFIRSAAKEGMFFILASQYLAFLRYEKGKVQEAYELLIPIRKHLSEEALCLLHRVAFDQKNYPLVVELAGNCYRQFPSPETALRNAYACAELKLSQPAIGWLQTAYQEGVQNLEKILSESVFDSIRHDAHFQDFLFTLKQQSKQS